MTTPEHQSPAPQPSAPETKDRVYRSPAGMAGGVLLLGLVGWLGLDAIIVGDGRTPWLALASLILLVPLIVAFTLRPAVFAGQDRLRVRNPFRVIVLPWGQVASLRSGYSNEVVAESGKKFQLWSIPVSLRARKKATRRESRAAAGRTGGQDARGARGGSGFGGLGGLGGGLSRGGGAAVPDGPARAETDRVMDELRELWGAREKKETAQGEVTARWAWEILGPAVAGAVVLGILLAVG
ncbi:PH domain-containing protein [Streptomyces asoensis]|uniref:PH domain-containing protein n=1 Tax=Streptomyces asoensis TaxID=249586 RepID=A0A6M4WWI5_9ACTN|nr:PH domain-containing protein [Streptomyces asoensis]QJT03695.1 PH domain-containing protein [Streptomyces asoensis]